MKALRIIYARYGKHVSMRGVPSNACASIFPK